MDKGSAMRGEKGKLMNAFYSAGTVLIRALALSCQAIALAALAGSQGDNGMEAGTGPALRSLFLY